LPVPTIVDAKEKPIVQSAPMGVTSATT